MAPKWITIHCSDSPNGRHVSTDEIRHWHIDPPPKGRGWRDIGYHAVVEIDGDVGKGRGEDEVGAHVEGHNIGNLGVCLVGRDRFTRAQFASLKWTVTGWMRAYNILIEDVMGHYEWDTGKAQGKTCPNLLMEDVRKFLQGDDSAIEKYILGVA